MRCPVCWREDVKTNAGGVNLAVHRDKAGRPCEGSGVSSRLCSELLEDMS